MYHAYKYTRVVITMMPFILSIDNTQNEYDTSKRVKYYNVDKRLIDSMTWELHLITINT